MNSSTRFQFGAALLLLAAYSAAAPAAQPISGATGMQACMAEYRIVFRSEGHPGKSLPFVRQELRAVPACLNAAPTPLYLTVYTDSPGGETLLEGDYDGAIAAIQEIKRSEAIASLRLTNLCVAQIASREWDNARTSCDAAVEASLRDRVRAPSWPQTARERYKHFVAIAYSNRAVLKLLSDDMIAGESDLVLAEKVSPRAPYVKRNLSATRIVRDARLQARTQPAG